MPAPAKRLLAVSAINTMKKLVFLIMCILLATNFTAIWIRFFVSAAHAEESIPAPAPTDANDCGQCPKCTFYTHPVEECRIKIYQRYKALLDEMMKRHDQKVKAKNDDQQ